MDYAYVSNRKVRSVIPTRSSLNVGYAELFARRDISCGDDPLHEEVVIKIIRAIRLALVVDTRD